MSAATGTIMRSNSRTKRPPVRRGIAYRWLSKQAKERALQDRMSDWDCFDDYYIIEDVKKYGKERGFKIDNVYWSGFWNQGDGASWVGEISIPTHIEWRRAQHEAKNEVPPAYLTVLEAIAQHASAVPVKLSGRACHEYSMWLDDGHVYDFDEDSVVEQGIFQGAKCQELWDALPIDVSDWLLDAARDYAREIYKAREAEYEYQTSAESFKELCEANDWRFDRDGKLHSARE